MLRYSRQPNGAVLRALCNGKTLAFQANDAGSIPAARFNQKIEAYYTRR